MKNKQIVIIDDNEAELRLYEEAYNETGQPYFLKKFTDAQSAFSYLVLHIKEVFIILCDISMPGMGGSDLLAKINKNHELKMEVIPFIFLSNSNIEKDVRKAYSLSAQGYFKKPMTLLEMEDLFKSIISYWSHAQIPRQFL
jgi:CheY-like chemotaxis protein